MSDEFVAKVRMFEAAYVGHWAIVCYILALRRDWVNELPPLGSRAGFRLVHQAAYHGACMATLLKLLAAGANFGERTSESDGSRTPAQVAEARGKPRCAANITAILNGKYTAEGVPTDFYCAISQEIMADPVRIATGSVFERAAISQWFAQHSTDPLTNADVPNKQLTPLPELQADIRAFLAANPQLQAD